jgi:hypothetical protein
MRSTATHALGALLVLVPALAAAETASQPPALLPSAAAPATVFSLGLESALPAVRIADASPWPLASGSPTAGGRPAADGGRIRLPDVRDLSTLRHRQEQTPAEPAAPADGGFGRWLKRHWWVPVLAAGAVAYAVSESGGDDDRLGEDD